MVDGGIDESGQGQVRVSAGSILFVLLMANFKLMGHVEDTGWISGGECSKDFI